MHHFSYIGDAEIGAGTSSAGTITCNYDGKRNTKLWWAKTCFWQRYAPTRACGVEMELLRRRFRSDQVFLPGSWCLGYRHGKRTDN